MPSAASPAAPGAGSERPGATAAGGGVPGIPRSLVLLLAVAIGVSVACSYYVQPLLVDVRRSFGVSSAAAALVVTASQIGYAVGLVFLVPLGDLVERRRLVVVMCLVTAAALVGSGLAPSLAWLYVFAAVAACVSVVAQVLVAVAAALAGSEERGRVVGTVMSGLLLGILLARTVAGYVAAASSWRVVYFMAAGLMAIMAVVLQRSLPRYTQSIGLTYPQVLRSVVTIFGSEAVLRRRALFGLLSFAAFAVLWTSLAFLLAGAPYHYGVGTIGLFGLAGAAGALTASVAGRLADRGKQGLMTVLMSLAMLAGYVVLWVAPAKLVALVVGIVVLDIGCQGMHITNQSEIYKLAGDARSRVNSAYMTLYFTGGVIGSVGSAVTYGAFGWSGVAGLGTGFGGLSILLALGERRFRSRRMAAAS